MDEERNNLEEGASEEGTASEEQSSQEESQSSPEAKDSKYVGEGKTFTSQDDFEKAYDESVRKIKEQGDELTAAQKKAQIADRLTQVYGISTEELEQRINQYAQQSGVQVPQTQQESSQSNEELQSVKKEIEELKLARQMDIFLKGVPEAGEYVDSIQEIAQKTGRSPRDVWNQNFAPVLRKGRESAIKELEEKQASSVTTSKSAAPPPKTKGYQQAMEEAMNKNPLDGEAHLDAWAKVIAERGILGRRTED